MQQNKGYACLISFTEQLSNHWLWFYVALLCDRLGSLILYISIFYAYTICDIQTELTATPCCVCVSLTWQHTDWTEHWVYCTAEPRYGTEQTGLHQPHSCHGEEQHWWNRSQAVVAHCSYMCIVFYPLCIPHDHIPQLQDKSRDRQQAWGQFFHII